MTTYYRILCDVCVGHVCMCACVCFSQTCYGIHGLSAVVGALRGALVAGEPPGGAAGEVHVGATAPGPAQAAAGVEHPPHVPHPARLVVRPCG